MKKQSAAAVAPPPPPTVGDMLIHYFELEGVKHVFGIPGGGLLNFLVNLKNNVNDIEYIICRQETGAAYMADGYYRVTGKLGVVVVTTGPGATNALTGIMNAQADGSAVMLLSGEIDEKYYGMGYLQEGVDGSLDINAIFKAATGYSSFLAAGSDAQSIMKQALRDALSIPRQSVHLSLPVNVTLEPLTNPAMPTDTGSYRTTSKGAPIGEVKKAMDALLDCKRPLLFLGNGCRDALRNPVTYANLIRFVETYSIPVITTADGKGIFPESHPMSLRVYGIANCMWPYQYLTAKAPAYDGIMILGSSLDELSTNNWLPILVPQGKNAPFIQVDINQKIIARSFPVNQGIVAEAGAFINEMAGLIKKRPVDVKAVQGRSQAIAKIKKQSPFINPLAYESTASPITPPAMMRVLQTTMPAGSKIFIDAGNCVGWAVHYLSVDSPSSIFTSLAMGPMGFAVGAVVGAKIGCPQNTCICITGDGAFMMNGSEISTAKQYNIGAIWIVLYDNNLAMVSQGMEHFAKDTTDPGIWSRLYELGNPDLVMFARSLGAQAYSVNSPSELQTVMPQVLNGANKEGIPQVIVVNIDRKMVPPYYNPIYSPAPPPPPPPSTSKSTSKSKPKK